jgi:molybdate transport system ATP-binding protein
MGGAAPVTSGGPRLQLDVTQRFPGGFTIAAALDVAMPAGSLLVLFGPSAAGKTTVLRHVAGFERPHSGVIRFGDEVWCDVGAHRWAPPQARGVGLVFQQPALFPHLTVRDNVRYGQCRDQVATRSRSGRGQFAEIVALLGIADLEHRYPRALSGGEAQRVALARALAPRPRLLLLDEPFAALDTPTRGRLRRDVRALLQSTGTPAVLVTHDRTEAMSMGDAVAVMIDGRVRQTGSVSDVFGRPADASVAAALGIDSVLPARVVGADAGLQTVAVNNVLLYVAERDVMPTGAAVYACIRAEDVTIESRSTGQVSARNHLSGRIVSMASEGPIDRVTFDCGFAIDALITRRSREELQLEPGAEVTVAIKATAIHLVPRH